MADELLAAVLRFALTRVDMKGTTLWDIMQCWKSTDISGESFTSVFRDMASKKPA
jgi:hypothetical protein